jgi:hypothetical protein
LPGFYPGDQGYRYPQAPERMLLGTLMLIRRATCTLSLGVFVAAGDEPG